MVFSMITAPYGDGISVEVFNRCIYSLGQCLYHAFPSRHPLPLGFAPSHFLLLMHPQSTPPVLFFVVPFVSFVLLLLEFLSLRRATRDFPRPRRTRQLVSLLFIISITSLSAFSGAVGLVASETGRAGNIPLSSHTSIATQLLNVFVRFESESLPTRTGWHSISVHVVGLAVLYLLGQRSLWDTSTTATTLPAFIGNKIVSVVLAHILVAGK
ncbi:hypothetical protein BV25DRAFT_1204679 [Artomyces pyxidatus]|uniref:Uncharacterized protein n=1 Tax=Artomyces pyxidatus TaxID=48021 RepID=A0ACB8SRE9_9AGAM|nr:hypothetical protein BV25DRAFT_1204679 [Artomyces pyxidatus]